MPHYPKPKTIEDQNAEAVDPAAICSHLSRPLPKASFQFGELVNVRCEEAGCPPLFLARVVAIRLIHGKVDYGVMDADGWVSDGYSEDWLSCANTQLAD